MNKQIWGVGVDGWMDKKNITGVFKLCVSIHLRQPLQEKLVELLLATAAARHAKQQRVPEERGAE